MTAHGSASPQPRPLGLRWTVGDVSSRGWEALRLSVHCAVRLFGPEAAYTVCVNSVPLPEAMDRAGELPARVRWHAVHAGDIPGVLCEHLDPAMAEGVGWKLVPLQLYPDRHELALDNDCILWRQPAALREFLARTDATLLAQDVDRALGRFGECAHIPGNINSGIRGLPPGFALGSALTAALREREAATGAPVPLHSELDEQGLQASALHQLPCLVVSCEEVSICSPFWPRQPELGTCGAHFVGLNSKHIPWNYFDRTGDHVRREHFDRHRPELYRRAELPLPPARSLDEA